MSTVKEQEVAIVIPLSLREEITDSEKVSLQHLITNLGRYDKYYIAADQLEFKQIPLDGIKIKRFPNKYFGSAQAHNRLMTNPFFYESFSEYKFILVYHLDSLVFSDQLLFWCNKGYDNIAPPWLTTDSSWLEKSSVGNGGFSLRKVESFIKLFSSREYWMSSEEFASKISEKTNLPPKLVSPLAKPMAKVRALNGIKVHLKQFLAREWGAEDRFISHFSNKYYTDFVTAPVDEAMRFAFEQNPRESFIRNNKKMPFGCHAYERYDVSFWEPHLLQPKDQIANVS